MSVVGALKSSLDRLAPKRRVGWSDNYLGSVERVFIYLES